MTSRGKPTVMRGEDSHPRREEIIAAAIRAFSARGYAGVTLQEIADDIGITKAAIYYYFRQKQDILGEALQRAGEALAANVRGFAERDDMTPTEKVYELLAAHVRSVLSHRALYSVYFSDISQVDQPLRDDLLRGERWYGRAFATVIEDGIKAGEFRDLRPRPTTLALLGMCNSTLRWFQPSHGLSAVELAEELATLACRGIVVEDSEFMINGRTKR
jgi:AcrR family transcriptional regulator